MNIEITPFYSSNELKKQNRPMSSYREYSERQEREAYDIDCIPLQRDSSLKKGCTRTQLRI